MEARHKALVQAICGTRHIDVTARLDLTQVRFGTMKLAIDLGVGQWLIVPLAQVETVLQMLSAGVYTYDWDKKEYHRDPNQRIELRLVMEEAIVEMPPADEPDEAGQP